MYKIAKLDYDSRKFLFLRTAFELGINAAIIEKDFWVCLLLDVIFNRITDREFFVFKGGTSLSKAFGIINRFSEDIDLVLDWTLLGVLDKEPFEKRSNTKQADFNCHINDLASKYLKDIFVPQLKQYINSLTKINMNVDIGEDPLCVFVFYPAIFNCDFIPPTIKLEIGPLASIENIEKRTITPYIAANINNKIEQSETDVICVSPERTFWEKITILHREANRPLNKNMPLRYSRHYYDVFMFTNSIYYTNALENINLLEKVIYFKNKFYKNAWANYDDILDGKLLLIPADNRIGELKKDYEKMKEMIYGEVPSFDDIIDKLKQVQKEINNLISNR